MEGPARVAIEPGADLGLLVSGVVVEDDVDCLVGRQLGLDGVQEADELLVAVTRATLRPITEPSSTFSAANSVVVPLRL